jgi:hypothetical protein
VSVYGRRARRLALSWKGSSALSSAISPGVFVRPLAGN